jgi:hypothetical protein
VCAPWPWANSGRDRPASTAGSPGTPARIESDDGQDSRHAGQALCPTRLNPPEQAVRSAQSLPYGARTRRLFSNFATPNGEGREGLFHQIVTKTQHMAFRHGVCPPSSRFHHLEGLHTRQVRAGCSLAHGQRGTPLPLVLAIPPHVVRIGKTPSSRRGQAPLFDRPLDGPGSTWQLFSDDDLQEECPCLTERQPYDWTAADGWH